MNSPTRRFVLLLLTPVVLVAAGPQGQPAGRAENLRRARELVAAGKVEQAISIYEELVRSSPNDAALVLNLAVAQYKAEHYRDSLVQADRALKLRPDLIPARLFLGASYLKLGEPAKAAGPLGEVVRTLPNDRNAQLMLAEALFALERYDEAAEHYQVSTGLIPNHPAAWYGLGQSYEALGKRASAELVRTAPESVYGLALLAESQWKQKRYGSAFELYKQAMAKKPDLRVLYSGLAAVYRASGHRDWAAAAEEKERSLPAPDCHSSSLECEFVAGRNQEVLADAKSLQGPEALFWSARAYEKLAGSAYIRLKRLPPSVESHELAAKEYELRGRPFDAVEEWKAALKLAPNDSRVRLGLAFALYQVRDYESSMPLLQELLERQPSSAELNSLYGSCLLNLEQPAKAIPYLEKGLHSDPDFLPAHAALGQAYLRTGEPELAIPHIKASLSLDEDGSRHYQLVRAYQASGRQELAKQALEEYRKFQSALDEERRKLDEISELPEQ